MNVRWFIVGALTLTALDAMLSSQAAADRTATLFTVPAAIIEHIVSPTLPAIPDLRKRAPAGSTTSDNPFLSSAQNAQAISASWTTQAAPPDTTTTTTVQTLLGVKA